VSVRTALATAFALLCFALNSLLCRMALAGGAIDAATFSTVRLISGAVLLAALVLASRRRWPARAAGWGPPLLLFLYAVPFSFAYLDLSVGAGALILFGTVQTTMIATGLATGERPRPAEWLGLLVALAGLLYLVWPGLEAPPLRGALLMATSGVAWGAYSLRGKGAADPLAATARNFALAVPFALGTSAAAWPSAVASARGVVLAVVSGALASGLGYVLWYSALRGLTATRAAVVQLLVPVLAAAMGAAALREPISLRLLAAATMILGGVGLALSPASPRRRDQ
jgi:drug/metabolite transporter (DMT)-like permease